jgi:hypothetical protein
MPRCRPFKLVDAMILVAVAALGMTEVRPVWNRFQAFWAGTNGAPTWQAYAGMAHVCWTMLFLNLVVAYIWIRLVPPRLPWSDVIRQPGMLFLILLAGLSFLLLALSAFVRSVAWANMAFALALGLSWVAACLRYRSRAEPGWIEGLGRSVGVGLLVSIAAT